MINENNVKRYCNGDITQIENYEKAINDTQTWDCHHRKETDEGLSTKQLDELGLLFDRPASELIFLTHEEHMSLHHKDKYVSGETRKKLSESLKGRIPWNKGLTTPEKTRRKNSESHKGKHRSEESKKKQRELMKGKVPFNVDKHRVYDENGKYHYE